MRKTFLLLPLLILPVLAQATPMPTPSSDHFSGPLGKAFKLFRWTTQEQEDFFKRIDRIYRRKNYGELIDGFHPLDYLAVSTKHLRSKSGEYFIIAMTIHTSWETNYFIYRKGAEKWVLHGTLDEMDKYGSHFFKVIESDGMTFLVSISSNGGAGFYHREENIHVIDSKGIGRCGSLFDEGSSILGIFTAYPFGVEYQSKPARPVHQNGRFFLEKEYKVIWLAEQPDGVRFKKDELRLLEQTYVMRYRWDPERKKFTFDPGYSDAKNEMDGSVFPEPVEFLRKNARRLRDLANRNADVRIWLEYFIVREDVRKSCPSEVAELRKVLKDRR